MDADLFGLKRKTSSAPALSRASRTETSKPGDKNKPNRELRLNSTPVTHKTSFLCVCVCLCRVSLSQHVSVCVRTEAEGVEERKPSSAPAAAVRSYSKFSIMGEL